MVGYWGFNDPVESGGTSADSSEHDSDATLQNDAKIVFGDTPFVESSDSDNGALRLDGVDDYASVEYDPSLDITPH